MMFARAPPGSIKDAARVLSDVRDSVDASADANAGEEGADSRKRSSGSCCTRLITLLTTLVAISFRNQTQSDWRDTHLDEAVRRVTVPEIPNRKSFTAGHLLNVNSKESDRVLLGTLVARVEGVDIGFDCDWGGGRLREEIVEVAQRNTEGEYVP